MDTAGRINAYIASQPEQKRADLLALHRFLLAASPGCRLWFLDGTDAQGKIVSNPNIGYGERKMRHANGDSREFYRVGLSANTTGISVYIIGLDDKTYLARTYGPGIGKAKVTGYCIKFKQLADIDMTLLEAAVRDGHETSDLT